LRGLIRDDSATIQLGENPPTDDSANI